MSVNGKLQNKAGGVILFAEADEFILKTRDSSGGYGMHWTSCQEKLLRMCLTGAQTKHSSGC